MTPEELLAELAEAERRGAEKEREACAKVAETTLYHEIAAAIRARTAGG